MPGVAADTTATIIPTLRYADAPAAVEWLCRAFGFERRLVVPDDDGGIAHAQLVFGRGMIMLGSARDDDFGRLQGPVLVLVEPGSQQIKANNPVSPMQVSPHGPFAVWLS